MPDSGDHGGRRLRLVGKPTQVVEELAPFSPGQEVPGNLANRLLQGDDV